MTNKICVDKNLHIKYRIIKIYLLSYFLLSKSHIFYFTVCIVIPTVCMVCYLLAFYRYLTQINYYVFSVFHAVLCVNQGRCVSIIIHAMRTQFCKINGALSCFFCLPPPRYITCLFVRLRGKRRYCHRRGAEAVQPCTILFFSSLQN